jgi:hypothetical protein
LDDEVAAVEEPAAVPAEAAPEPGVDPREAQPIPAAAISIKAASSRPADAGVFADLCNAIRIVPPVELEAAVLITITAWRSSY